MTLTESANGAHLTGSVVNVDEPSAGFDVDVMFQDKSDYLEWIALYTIGNNPNPAEPREPKLYYQGQTGYDAWDYYVMN